MLDEFMEILREATRTVEEELKAEDEGWNLLGTAGEVVRDIERINAVKKSRWYYLHDPLGKQSIRLWTDYTFGSGMTWKAKEDSAQKALEGFWDSKANQGILSARGQRLSSDRLLVDGEIFFALFLGPGGVTTIRRIDPLEITQIITDPDDIEDVKFYRRVWANRLGQQKESIYRSIRNPKGDAVNDISNIGVTNNEEARVYHLAYNTIGQRGNPLLLPAIDWIKQYRRFLASRVAVMLALAKFAWRGKVKGGSAAVEAAKAVYHDQEVAAASTQIENEGFDLTPIKADSGARNAYQDGRMIKLQVCAGVGISEQYYGDIETGNLATAKTVELPMIKMFQSYQSVWGDAYKDIDEIVLEHNNIAPDKWYVDRDFPPIAPKDVAALAVALPAILQNLPEFASIEDVQQVALMILGINNPGEVLDALKTEEAKGDPYVKLTRAFRELREVIKREKEVT